MTNPDMDERPEERAEMPTRILRATFAVDGVPYSQFHLYDGDDVEEQVAKARTLSEVYGKAFAPPQQEGPPVPQNVESHATSTNPPQQRTAPAQGGSGQDHGTGLFCPQGCGELGVTKKEWQEYDAEGRPDKFFCGSDQHQGKATVYRRQALLDGEQPQGEPA